MMKFFVSICILTTLLLVGAGCSVSDKYCCESNDLCDPVGEDLYSCSVETCQCVLVQPITVAVVGDWKDPMVKQDNYRIELQATGGLTPYIWKDFTIVGDTEGKLSWLTLQEDANDPSIAYLTNRVENDVPLVPNKETAAGEELKIKVTVMDSSKHGTKEQTVDNFGYVFEHRIEIRPSACESGDGFCPAECNIGTDNDCPIRCGDGVVSDGETCDGNCPTSCDDGIACTTDTLQNADTCQAECLYTEITECKDGDGCCPVGCNHNTDSDCSATCGNGAIEKNEICDPPSTCPTTCPDDGNKCTNEVLTGSAANCNVVCTHPAITPCCGNGKVEAGETCDGNCPTSCDDGNACTTDTLIGIADNCTAACTHQAITVCQSGDGCCPAGCNAINDSDCKPICGNGVIESGEKCDPPSATCSDDCKKICIDLAGTWITRITTTGTITEPELVVTFTGATIDVVQRMVISKVGDNYSAQFEICSLSTTASGVITFSVDYSAAVLKSLSGTATSPYACYQVKDTVALPSFTINSGWGGPPDPATNDCPSIYGLTKTWPPAVGTFPTTCSGAVDTDGDGVYGITLPTHFFGGALNFFAAAGLTMNITLNNMVLTDATTNTGTTSFPTTGYVFGSTSGATGNLNVVPDSSAVPVTAIKLAGDVDCTTVLTHCTGAACVP